MAGKKPLPPRTPGHLGRNDAHDPTALDPGTSLRLGYEAVDADLLRLTKQDTSPVGHSKTLALKGTQFFLHGNNRVTVYRNSLSSIAADGTSRFPLFRVFRVWIAPLDSASRRRIGNYSTGGSTSFVNDGAGGYLWIDVPGVTVERTPEARGAHRHLMEFLVGVQDNPEAGGLYFNLVLDETPEHYRVAMHREISYDAKKWQEIFPMWFGFRQTKGEDRATVAIVQSKPFGTEDDFDVIQDYGGWTPFPKA